MKVLKIIWIVTIITSFFGPTLSLAAYQNIFAYRILLLIHWGGFLFYVIWKRRRFSLQLNIKDYLWFYGLWFCWATLSFFWADSKVDTIRHVWFLFSGISLIGFTVIHVQKERDLKNLFLIFIGILTLFLGVSLWEHFHRYNVGVGGSALFFERGIPNAFMGNPNDLATFLALYFPFFFCLIKYGRNRIWQLVGLAGMIMTFHIILLTRSRANLLALGIMVLVMIWFLKPWTILKNIFKRKKTTVIVTVSIIVISLLGIYLINHNYTLWHFITKEKQMFLNQFGSLAGSSSITIRWTLMMKGWELLRNHYFLGVGAGNIEYHMMPFKELTQGIVNMHNWWAELLVNYGVIVWGLYMYCFGKMLMELIMIQGKSENRTLKMMAEILLISFSGFSIAVTSSSTMAASRYMWMLFAVTFSVINIHRAISQEKTR